MRKEERPVAKIGPSGKVLELYQGAKEAAEANFLSYSTIWSRCNGKAKNPFKAMGYSFKWADEGEEGTGARKKRKQNHRGMSGKKRVVVKIDVFGKVVAVYDSVTEAAKANNKSPSVITRRCLGDYKNPLGRDEYGYFYMDQIAGCREGGGHGG